MTYYADTCKRCNSKFFWHRQPNTMPPTPVCNTCENELAELDNEVVSTVATLDMWDDLGGEG